MCILSRKQYRKWEGKNKRIIDECSAIVREYEKFGHWEVDTVVGKCQGKDAVVFTMVERVTDHYIAIKIHGRNSAGVSQVMGSAP